MDLVPVQRRAETQTTTLGRYRVVKRLANGGMADVLLARTEGIQGFERHVVIKRIHPELLEESRYIKMFLDEARLAASLHHHNIVQVNDIGEHAGEYFFAMEYVHGEDARGLLINATEHGQQIPIEHAITIICGAAAGLHHAHEQCSADRQPLGIVHRDVSPANILVGFDGSVKVADFGIALAAHRAEQTQSGVLKGKVAYMSPEQCNCERVDRRSDVFSLGICLYELATVHPCFTAANDFLTMSAIVNGKITPPSHLSAHVPKALEAIILKALARNPKDRYQTADELRIALEQYAARANIRNSTTALADYMKAQFGERALPWQDVPRDDDEPEMIVLTEAVTPLPLPLDAHRPVKRTLPLRTVKPVSKLPLPAPDLSPLPGRLPEAPLAVAHESTLPLPAANVAPAAVAPVADEHTQHVRIPARSHVGWLLVLLLVVAAAAAGLWLAASGSPRSAAQLEPAARRHIAPLPAPTFRVPAAAPAEVDPAKPAKKTARKKAAAPAPTASEPAPEKKWDPDALFPQ